MSDETRRIAVIRAAMAGVGIAVLVVLLGIRAVWTGEPVAVDPAELPAGEDAHERRTVVLEADVAHGSASSDSPNVVLVLGCTVRRDQVTPYGGHPEATPFLAELASNGAVLDDAIAAAPWTRAASAALITGRHPVSLGLVEPGPDRNDRVLPDAAQTLAEQFAAGGYTTVGATANPNLNAVYGFSQGFDRYLQPAALWREDRAKLGGPALLRDLFDVIDTRPAPDRPLYLQVMFVDAHAPWMVETDEIRRVADPAAPRPLWPYRAGLRRLDDSVRSLWDGLQQRGFTRENTVFVFVSDHGEGLLVPPHHGRSHGRYLYPSAVHAAFVATGPGIPAGHRVAGPASGIDVAPTVLGLAGLDADRVGFGGDAPRDLSDALSGSEGGTGRLRAWTDTWFMTADRAAFYEPERACMASFADAPTPGPTGRFVPGCYDRDADPTFADARPDASAQQALADWRDAQLAAAQSFRTATAEPDADRDRQLEALGYVERDPEESPP
jgi:hypothetical protein